MSLDLNYQPKALVDTATLTEDEWLAWRKKGIGGSDVAAALNLSPYRTARELYYDKIGVEPVICVITATVAVVSAVPTIMAIMPGESQAS